MLENGKNRDSEVNYYTLMRNSLVKLYFKDITFTFFMTILAEFSAVYYTYMVGDLIRFIKSDSQDMKKGIMLVSTFILFMLIAQIARNRYMFNGI